MSFEIEVSLFGFGDDRPTCFGNRNKIQLTLDNPASVSAVLLQAGFVDTNGLVIMLNNSAVAEKQWHSRILSSGDKLKILSAFEGG